MLEKEFGTTPVVIVEIDQDQCALEYGVAPCTADAASKCYNTWSSCQDLDNYDRSTLTLRFCEPHAIEGFDYGYMIPSIVSVSTAPTRINVAGRNRDSGSLGNRAVCDIVFRDHPHSDLLVDKYRAERTYVPIQSGTFWGKWLARNPFYFGREVRVYEGYLGQPMEEMRVRTYIIDAISGPDSDGRVRLRAKDFLKLADGDRSVAPRPTLGETSDAMNNVQQHVDMTNVNPGDYPSSGTVRIGDECMTYMGVNFSFAPGVTRLTGITRGTDGTSADTHEANESVQLCLRYTNEPSYIVTSELLQNFASIPSSAIPLADWQDEWETFLPQFTVTALITEPTPVQQLVAELAQQSLFNVWWDERQAIIPFRAVRTPEGPIRQIDEETAIIKNSLSFERRTEDRISQVWVYFGIRNPTEDEDEPSNYARRRISADLDAETPNEYGEAAIYRVFSRWLTTEAQAINVTSLLLNQFRNPPLRAQVRLDAKDRDLWTADVLDIRCRSIQTETGERAIIRCQVLSAEEIQTGEVVEYELQTFPLPPRVGRWMADGSPIYANATEEERYFGMWWADDDGLVDGDDGYGWQ